MKIDPQAFMRHHRHVSPWPPDRV